MTTKPKKPTNLKHLKGVPLAAIPDVCWSYEGGVAFIVDPFPTWRGAGGYSISGPFVSGTHKQRKSKFRVEIASKRIWKHTLAGAIERVEQGFVDVYFKRVQQGLDMLTSTTDYTYLEPF